MMLAKRIKFILFLIITSVRSSAVEGFVVNNSNNRCVIQKSTARNAISSSPLKNNQNNQIQNLFDKFDELYTKSTMTIKCPFFKRRAADLIDNLALVTRFLIIRHKSLLGDRMIDPDAIYSLTTTSSDCDEGFYYLDSVMMPPGCRSRKKEQTKSYNLSIQDIADIIYHDWTSRTTVLNTDEHTSSKKTQHHKGYYITGQMNTTIYKDDCLFSGPDPDMPVKGLRKYLAAASKLFDHSKSYADLLELQILSEKNQIQVKWEIGGVIMLPWHPEVKPWTGKTIYHIDIANGLIYKHEEFWDISVFQAFICTIWPKVGERLFLEAKDKV